MRCVKRAHGQLIGAVEGMNVGGCPFAELRVPLWATWPAVVTESWAAMPLLSSNLR